MTAADGDDPGDAQDGGLDQAAATVAGAPGGATVVGNEADFCS